MRQNILELLGASGSRESLSGGAWHVIFFPSIGGNGKNPILRVTLMLHILLVSEMMGCWIMRVDVNGARWTRSIRAAWPVMCSKWHSTLSAGPSWHSSASAFTSPATHLKCNQAVGEYLDWSSRKPHCSHVSVYSRKSSLMSICWWVLGVLNHILIGVDSFWINSVYRYFIYSTYI